MARLLSQTLIRTASSSWNSLQTLRHTIPQANRFSSKSGKAQLIQVEIESDGEVEVLGLRKLEDVIHNILLKQSVPDWLPFVPGSSYWIPPHLHRPESLGLSEVLEKLSNPLTEDEFMSFSSPRGWPSSAYFIGECYVLYCLTGSKQPLYSDRIGERYFPGAARAGESC